MNLYLKLYEFTIKFNILCKNSGLDFVSMLQVSNAMVLMHMILSVVKGINLGQNFNMHDTNDVQIHISE